MTTETPVKPVKPGQIYFNIDANDGWRYLKVIKVRGEIVEVEFLEPKDYWHLNATGALQKSELLKDYRLTPERQR